MAIIPLRSTDWYYDEETNRVVGKFWELPPDDHPDATQFRPRQFFTIEFMPTVMELEERALPAEEPQNGP